MSRDGSVVLTFHDGEEYLFRLAWGQLSKLQEALNAGPFVVLDRLHMNTWRVEDIAEVIKWGLVGGGMNEVKARKLVREYVEVQAPFHSLEIAVKVIDAAVMGPPDAEELEKKVQAQPSNSNPSTMDGSPSEHSTALAH